MEQNNKYWEGCYVKEEKWIKYCKGVKRKTYQGLPVQIILPNDTVVTPEEYWKSKEKKKGRWKPEKGEKYYSILATGMRWCYIWMNEKEDNHRYSTGNCFKTEKEAEEHKKKLIYQQQYRDYALEHNDEIDWKTFQLKHCACYNNDKNKIGITHWESTEQQGVVHFTNDKDILDFIKLIGEDNFKKYILEVDD